MENKTTYVSKNTRYYSKSREKKKDSTKDLSTRKKS